MEKLESIIIGFMGGFIVWTYINTVKILWKINKILKDKAL